MTLVLRQTNGEEVNERSEDILVTTPIQLLTPINRSPVTPNNSFSLQLVNVIDEIARNDIGGDHESAFSPVKETTLDVSSIVALDDATVDSVLHNEVEFMQNWLPKAAVNNGPFTPVVSKSQKKKFQKATYQTRSQGLPTPSQ